MVVGIALISEIAFAQNVSPSPDRPWNFSGERRDAATALLQAARQSYIAAVEAYGFGVRSLLDVTAAQRVLAQARSADVSARTSVLDTLADLAFRTGDLVRMGVSKVNP
jgi:outer membrane protein TolC